MIERKGEGGIPQIEKQTRDGKLIVYLGPHPFLLPAVKLVTCPIIGLSAEVKINEPMGVAIKTFEDKLFLSAQAFIEFSTEENYKPIIDYLKHLGISKEELNRAYQKVNSNIKDVSRCVEYRNASVEESENLSRIFDNWKTTLVHQVPGNDFPVVDLDEFRNKN